MSRIGWGLSVLVLVGGAIVAIVKAEGEPAPMPLIGVPGQIAASVASPSTEERSFASPNPGVQREGAVASPSRGASDSSEPPAPQPVILRPGGDSGAGLRSVLKRPVSKTTAASAQAVSENQMSPAGPESLPVGPEVPATMSPAKPIVPLINPPRVPATVPPLATKEGAVSPEPRVATRSVTSRRVNGPGLSTPQRVADAVVSSSGPLLRVDTKGPPAIIVGEEAAVVVTTTNLSDTEAKDVTVQVAIPEGVQLSSAEANSGQAVKREGAGVKQGVVWTLERVPARTERQLTLKVTPQVNQAFEVAVTWSMAPLASTARIEVQQPLLQLALTGPSEIVYGETKSYSIVLSNPGTGEARNVAIQLALGSGNADTLSVPALAAGESKTFDVEVTALEVGTMQINATATGDGKLKTQASHQLVVLRADLRLDVVGPPQQFSGSTGTYQVRMANTGNAVARNIQAAVRLPSGVKYLKGLEGVKQAGDSLVWAAGDLAPTAERTYQFTCQLTADGDNTFRFGVRSEGGVEAASEMLTRVDSVADLKLSVNDPKGPIPVGDEVTYEVCILNRGTKAAVAVSVVAQFSEGIEPVTAEGGKAEMLPGQVLFRPIAQIAANETVVLKIKARAQAPGNHLFRAEVKCPDPETKLVAEGTTRYFGTDASPRK